jgi:hypothetical protein
MPKKDPTDKQYIEAAFKKYHRDGEIEIDKDCTRLPKSRVSRGDDPGAYVMAWVWVSNDDLVD